MQLLRLAKFIDSDLEKFDIWLWEIWIQYHVRTGQIRVSKMSGLENPSDARTKYFGPEPLQRHSKACNWVLVDGKVQSTTKVGQ